MSAKNRLSRDQKRRAKLAQRAQKRPEIRDLAYSGTKYQAECWVPQVFQTELGIYEAYRVSGRTLTNKHLERALIDLIHRLRDGLPAPLQEGEEEIACDDGVQEDFLIWNIRRNWAILFEERGPVSRHDLIGILRTLLHSILAHAWNTGPGSGYLHFLEQHMRDCGVEVRKEAVPK
jgi:hypothetical protein